MIKSMLAAAVLLATSASPLLALNARTWISGHGVDQASCGPVSSPCRTLQYAHDNTSSGGEIDVLDPAGYGNLLITKAISVVNDGVGTAGALAPPGGVAITVSAEVTDPVVLRGLTIAGSGTGQTGVLVNSARGLTILNSTISGFTGTGIEFLPNNIPGSTTGLTISNCIFALNDTGGVLIKTTGGIGTYVSISRSLISGTGKTQFGIASDASNNQGGFISTNIDDTLIRAISGDALRTVSTGAVVTRSTITFNINAFAPTAGVIAVNASTVTNNTNVAFGTSGGSIRSYGNNLIDFYNTLGPVTNAGLR